MNNTEKHNHSHHHHHEGINSTAGRLIITMLLNFVITVAEIIGGILSGSLSLISDAMHNFSDGISVIISYIAIKLKKRDHSEKHTFGLKRAEILAAVINASVLIIISIYLFYEAAIRFLSPEIIDAKIMSLVAAIGLVANVAGTMLLKRDSKESLNIKSSYLHLLSDAVSSAGVIIGGISIALWNAYWIDPLLTVLIGIYIIRESYFILSDAVHVLMEGAPPGVDPNEIQKLVEEFEEVDDIHHVHLWMVGDNDVHFEAHVNVKDMKVSESDSLRMKIEKALGEKFGISHITLQFECNQCLDDGLIGNHK